MPSLIVPVGELDFLRSNIDRMEPFDVPIDHGGCVRVAIDRRAYERLAIAAERSCCQTQYFGVGKASEHLAPGIGDIVVAFINQDHVEKIIRELRQPAIRGACQLLNVRNNEMASDAVVNIRVPPVEHSPVWAV